MSRMLFIAPFFMSCPATKKNQQVVLFRTESWTYQTLAKSSECPWFQERICCGHTPSMTYYNWSMCNILQTWVPSPRSEKLVNLRKQGLEKASIRNQLIQQNVSNPGSLPNTCRIAKALPKPDGYCSVCLSLGPPDLVGTALGTAIKFHSHISKIYCEKSTHTHIYIYIQLSWDMQLDICDGKMMLVLTTTRNTFVFPVFGSFFLMVTPSLDKPSFVRRFKVIFK